MTLIDSLFHWGSKLERVLVVALVLVGLQLALWLLRRAGRSLAGRRLTSRASKVATIVSLTSSIILFVTYFVAFGLILRELGLSLKAYLTSASIIGLAVGFGSQGIVQDVVTGVTMVFADLFDVGDMVEISGQTGIIRGVGMRFTELENSFGARVLIPNRTIGNVINYPKGYIRALVDVNLPAEPELAQKVEARVSEVASGALEQYGRILLAAPSIEGRVRTSSGKEILRVKFRVWPGRGTAIETGLRSELLALIKRIVPEYEDWMVTVNYEIEKRHATLPGVGWRS
ncbi:MAG: mechanosensitive ion channel family protein [Candidatus Krumholzibacteria bacterium]|nr:mechanosensitive ion channel family protein [Candidatus Krumholzibacteria bacterium]